MFTNCEEITLLLNDKKIETRKIEKYDQALFTLDFEPGVLEVDGIKNGNTYTDKLVTSGKTSALTVTEIEPITKSDDIAIYEINAFDENGNYNPTASENVQLEINGGEIVGVCNGDPADLSYEQQESSEQCEIIRSFNYEHGLYMVDKKVPNKLNTRYNYLEKEDKKEGFEDDYRLIANYKDHLNPIKTYTFTRALTNVSDYEYIEFECLLGRAKVYLNGEFIGDNLRSFGVISASNKRPYRFYCNFKEGDNDLKIDFEIFEEDGQPISGYVKVGKTVKPSDWAVKLHYGKARVFVKSNTPDKVTLSAKLKK